MIDYTEIAYDTDGWELFARDYLSAKGFYIESTVDRGPDHGKDMLVTEKMSGKLGNYQLRWLVSCKHFATSKKSVSEDHEPNIMERLAHFKSDGFIGFYSTLASSGLNSRLKALRDNKQIKDYSIMDGRLIENTLVSAGYSPIMMRYFPKSYQVIRPLHFVLGEYQPLECKVCRKDLLTELFFNRDCGIIAHVYSNKPGPRHYSEVYVACKGMCDRAEDQHHSSQGRMTSGMELDYMVVPIKFLSHVIGTMKRIREGASTYTEEAFEQELQILVALAQRVLRNTTDEERDTFMKFVALG